MDLLKSVKNEIMKKRKEIEEANLVNSNKKYFKRGELNEKQTEMFVKKLQETSQMKKIMSEDENSNDSGKHDKHKAHKSKDDDIENHLPRNEVIRRLRELGEPIRLFGESDIDAAKRLSVFETQDVESNGMRNDFKAAIEKSEQESLKEIMNSIDQDHDEQPSTSKSEEESHDDEVHLKEIMALAEIKGDRNNDNTLVLKFLKFIIKKWGSQLISRPLNEKMTVGGRIDFALHAQTVSYMKPLFRKLKSKTLSDDILDSLVKIVLELIARNYIKANEYFLEMAIGNAAWPIGATMVGIHARPGRERIASKHVAHVLNDETQRKYIQAVKRLISKCQQYFPTDPSRCVEYGLKNENITIIPGGK